MTTSTVFVYTKNRVGEVGAWSRYAFPFGIDNFCQFGDDLYIRSGDDVLKLDQTAVTDFAGDTTVPTREAGFAGTIWTPWLDIGSPGISKELLGFDIVGSGSSSVAIGYDQTNIASFTDAVSIPADTLPGMVVPIHVRSPSFSVKIVYAAGQAWHFQAMNLYLKDSRIGS